MGMFARVREKTAQLPPDEVIRAALEYDYIANMMNAMIVYNHGCGIQRMKEKRERVEQDLKTHYPTHMQNRNLRFLKPRSVSMKIRLGVGAFYWSRKLHLYKAMLALVSLL